MMTTRTMSTAANNDAELVSASLSGDRDAFGQIVARYQSLVCSLAYSATGSLSQSEDLAQETFVAAWKQLPGLREPEKLRAWLCGIARNLINNWLRKQGREPSHQAESLEDISESHSPEPLPWEQTISNEEQAILWRSLERIPEIYREPLILFYREHQSVETVAQNLELTEDTVKQRLSRGRKLLQEQVLAFVEGALERTNPGKVFTLGVLAALPATLATSAKAATLAAGTKAAGTMGVFGMLISPLMVLFGNYIPYRIGMAEARSEEERRQVKLFFRKVLGLSFGLSVGLLALFWFTLKDRFAGGMKFNDAFTAWFISFVIFYLLVMFWFAIAGAQKRRAEMSARLAEEHGCEFPPAAFEYRSKAGFLGLPLVNIRVGDRFDLLRPPVKGWIAVGNFAFGGLFAFGGVAMAPFSIGALTFGLFAFGGVAFGFAALGGLAFGAFALGGIIVGWQAIGGCAIGWQSATGSLAFAHDYALGGIARAWQANNDSARQFIESGSFLPIADFINRHILLMNLVWIAPLLIQWRLIVRKNKLQANQKT